MPIRLLACLFIVWSSLRAEDPVITVMTYNLRFASETPPNAWSERRPLMVDLIRSAEPDVIGTQEALYSQVKDLETDLPDFDWIGLGRDGGSRGEFMAVFYHAGRLEPVAFDHFWLSDTPAAMGSASWGNLNRRMVTWVQFRHRATGNEFFVWNTHFDHEVQTARERSAWLIRQRIAELRTNLPVILVGDFNAAAGANPVYDALVGDGYFSDTWTLAGRRMGEGLGTFNGFGETPQGRDRIDWILARGPVEVLETSILSETPRNRYPSDHYPVTARLVLPNVTSKQ